MVAAAAADELRELLENRRSKARELISRCTKLEEKRLEGAHKLMRKLEAELNFLEHVSAHTEFNWKTCCHFSVSVGAGAYVYIGAQ